MQRGGGGFWEKNMTSPRGGRGEKNSDAVMVFEGGGLIQKHDVAWRQGGGGGGGVEVIFSMT